MIFFLPYNPHPPTTRQTPRPSHPRELDFGPFRVRFGSVSGCWAGSGRELGESGFCKGKEYQWSSLSWTPTCERPAWWSLSTIACWHFRPRCGMQRHGAPSSCVGICRRDGSSRYLHPCNEDLTSLVLRKPWPENGMEDPGNPENRWKIGQKEERWTKNRQKNWIFCQFFSYFLDFVFSSRDGKSGAVLFFFPHNPPHPPTIPTKAVPPSELDFGPFRLRFGSVSGPFRLRFGSASGCRVGSGRGASVREKNITRPVAHNKKYPHIPGNPYLGVVLPHLPGEIFRAICSRAESILFSIFQVDLLEACSFHRSQSILVAHQILVNFSQFVSILVGFNQVTQDKKARISCRQEAGAKQHPTIPPLIKGVEVHPLNQGCVGCLKPPVL